MADEGTEGGFKVTDRRRRPEASGGPVPTSGREVADASAHRQAPAEEVSTHRPAPPEAVTQDERSLVGLFVMLGSTAAVALGAPDPLTGESHRDPAQAADVIDLLVLLRQRTEGHRTPEETQVLDELVYDLQLRYVEVMKRSE